MKYETNEPSKWFTLDQGNILPISNNRYTEYYGLIELFGS